MPRSERIFGIPITKGKIRATGESGVVVSFNLRQLYLRRLLRAQLFSSDQKPLTLITTPHPKVTDIFNYPLLKPSVDFAFAQKEYTAFVFINTTKLTFSESLRVIFWFARYPIPVKNDDDKVDVPNEAIPLLTATVAKEFLLHLGKPVPEELEKTIAEEEKKLKGGIDIQNYWISDTLNLTLDELSGLDKDDEEILEEEKRRPTKIWTRSKSEFCQFIKEEYEKHRNQYSDPKDAVCKIYPQYKFSFRWSKKRCYELLKKVP
jgi:hypothetical protein